MIIIATFATFSSPYASSPGFTNPSGFTSGSALTSALADTGWGSNYIWTHVCAKIATSADLGNPTYTVTCGESGNATQQVIMEAGPFSSVNAALPNNLWSADQASKGGPITYAFTSVTGVAGGSDIIVVGCAADQDFTGTTTVTCSGYTDGLTTLSSTTAYQPIVASFLALGVPAGTAPAASMVFATPGDGAAETIGFMMTVAGAHAPKQRGGMFFADVRSPKLNAKAVAMFMPLGWIIDRRNRLKRRC